MRYCLSRCDEWLLRKINWREWLFSEILGYFPWLPWQPGMKSEKKSYFFFHFGTPVIHTKFHKNILNIKKKGFQVPYLALKEFLASWRSTWCFASGVQAGTFWDNLYRQVISCYHFDDVGYTGPSFPWGRILTTRVISISWILLTRLLLPLKKIVLAFCFRRHNIQHLSHGRHCSYRSESRRSRVHFGGRAGQWCGISIMNSNRSDYFYGQQNWRVIKKIYRRVSARKT